MQIIILAAGYATRLYPLTLNRPKPLLPVGGRPMLEHILEHLSKVPGVDEYLLVTNDKFVRHFTEWSEEYRRDHPEISVNIINDQTRSAEDKLGAIGDMHLVTQKVPIRGDLLVVGGDNLFDQSLAPFVEYCRRRQAPVLATYDVGNLEAIKKYSSVTVNAEGKILVFEEKPTHPTSTLTGIALYYYPASCVCLIDRYLQEGNNPDQPGRFIQWLYLQMPVYTCRIPGRWYDIGNKKNLEEADRSFSRDGVPEKHRAHGSLACASS